MGRVTKIKSNIYTLEELRRQNKKLGYMVSPAADQIKDTLVLEQDNLGHMKSIE